MCIKSFASVCDMPVHPMHLTVAVVEADCEASFHAVLTESAAGKDFAFINLHGSPGEDGLIQAMLEKLGVAMDRARIVTDSRMRTNVPGGRNGHFPNGIPADYRDYNAEADVTAHGIAFGGYPDAETEAAAFEKAVLAMAANHEKSPAAKAGSASARIRRRAARLTANTAG